MTQMVLGSIPTFIEIFDEFNAITAPITAKKIINLLEKIDLALKSENPGESIRLKELKIEVLKYAPLAIANNELEITALMHLNRQQTSI